ncbi:MAG: hypothetical protein ACLQJL_04240 [Roseiarcus sp.]
MSPVPIAMISPEEFERGRGIIPEFCEHPSYEDWLDCREGLFMGLSMSGVDSRLVDVSLKDFLLWCQAEGLPPSEPALDSFALRVLSAAAPAAPLVNSN